MNRREKIPGKETARRMAPFRPGIGKHEMKNRDRTRGQQVINGIRNFEPHNTRIRKAGALELATSAPHPSNEPFDSQEISRCVLRRDGGEKRAVSAPEIDLERRAAAVDRFEIERRKTIGRDELRLACYGCRRIGGQNVRC